MPKWPTWNPKGPHRICFPCPDCGESVDIQLGYTVVKSAESVNVLVRSLGPAAHRCGDPADHWEPVDQPELRARAQLGTGDDTTTWDAA